MKENEISSIVVDACVTIHREVGPGLLESAYERVLAFELMDRGLCIRQQVPIPFVYKNRDFGEGFRADFIVEDKVILELKAVEKLAPVHKKQLFTYLALTGLKLGLLLNFGASLMKDGIYRIARNLEE